MANKKNPSPSSTADDSSDPVPDAVESVDAPVDAPVDVSTTPPDAEPLPANPADVPESAPVEPDPTAPIDPSVLPVPELPDAPPSPADVVIDQPASEALTVLPADELSFNPIGIGSHGIYVRQDGAYVTLIPCVVIALGAYPLATVRVDESPSKRGFDVDANYSGNKEPGTWHTR